jgi:hypothetical protein
MACRCLICTPRASLSAIRFVFSAISDKGLADIARLVIGWHLLHKAGIPNALVDVASNSCQARAPNELNVVASSVYEGDGSNCVG